MYSLLTKHATSAAMSNGATQYPRTQRAWKNDLTICVNIPVSDTRGASFYSHTATKKLGDISVSEKGNCGARSPLLGLLPLEIQLRLSPLRL